MSNIEHECEPSTSSGKHKWNNAHVLVCVCARASESRSLLCELCRLLVTTCYKGA